MILDAILLTIGQIIDRKDKDLRNRLVDVDVKQNAFTLSVDTHDTYASVTVQQSGRKDARFSVEAENWLQMNSSVFTAEEVEIVEPDEKNDEIIAHIHQEEGPVNVVFNSIPMAKRLLPEKSEPASGDVSITVQAKSLAKLLLTLAKIFTIKSAGCPVTLHISPKPGEPLRITMARQNVMSVFVRSYVRPTRGQITDNQQGDLVDEAAVKAAAGNENVK